MSWYDNTKPTRPIETDEGIKARSNQGEFVKNWWATRWIEAMERVLDRGRLQRGRSYARKGQVSQSAQCSRLLTFDRRFVSRARGVSGTEVEIP